MINFASKIIKKFSRRIIRSTDFLRGLDFYAAIEPEEVGLDPKWASPSTLSENECLRKVLDDLPIQKEGSIIDIGCGKGSALRTMLKYAFSRVDEVEISEHIANIAKGNFEKLKVNAERLNVIVENTIVLKIMICIAMFISIIHFLHK